MTIIKIPGIIEHIRSELHRHRENGYEPEAVQLNSFQVAELKRACKDYLAYEADSKDFTIYGLKVIEK